MKTTDSTARWLNILEPLVKTASVEASASPVIPLREGSGEGVSLQSTFGKHRVWIVACLEALEAQRHGQTIRFARDLPDLSFPVPAARGARAAEAVWQAYLQFCLGSDDARKWLTDAIRSLNPTALRAGIDDNPEPWWANELLILHAMQSFVCVSGATDLQAELDRCVDFHVAEIQPDHATNEPWAIHAFLRHPQGETSAGSLLHAAMVQGGGELTPVAGLILRDAIHCLKFSRPLEGEV